MLTFHVPLRADVIPLPRVPEYTCMHHQPTRAQVIRVPFTIPLTQLASLSVKRCTRSTMPSFSSVALCQNPPPIRCISTGLQTSDCLDDPPTFTASACQLCWAVTTLQRAYSRLNREHTHCSCTSYTAHFAPLFLRVVLLTLRAHPWNAPSSACTSMRHHRAPPPSLRRGLN